ncbi:hypothetical protein FGO68_gene11041 [Halteria grandinella]|uniref:Uncharacterized protein n=1 Tax=Halteria grandinella TaxID=5974 RepID=A0A8J8N9L8_HALGN|nr:hypothetical protein FGO68_gene11041 [Halteria grandinella]
MPAERLQIIDEPAQNHPRDIIPPGVLTLSRLQPLASILHCPYNMWLYLFKVCIIHLILPFLYFDIIFTKHCPPPALFNFTLFEPTGLRQGGDVNKGHLIEEEGVAADVQLHHAALAVFDLEHELGSHQHYVVLQGAFFDKLIMYEPHQSLSEGLKFNYIRDLFPLVADHFAILLLAHNALHGVLDHVQEQQLVLLVFDVCLHEFH